MMKAQILFLTLFLTNTLFSQQGGILLNSKEATVGYSLFNTNGVTYLVDNCGEIVNSWNATYPENHCKLLPDGNLIYISSNRIYEKNWDDEVVNSVLVTDNTVRLKYEVVKLKNGNYLCVGREPTSLTILKSFGYDLNFTTPTQSDIVVEIDGKTGAVVWRWNLLDHVIQNKFPTKKAYGVLKDNPGKININAIATYDWNETESFMINGMDYNEDLDQIVLSVRKIGEIVIIDHSTTTQEAKTSSGGKYKKGGDLLYRYGNPANYERGTTDSRQLYFQHNPNWIKYGEHKGKIILFNNLLSYQSYSTVQIVDPLKNSDGSYKLEVDKPFMPIKPTVEYGKTAGKVEVSSGYTSGAKVLPNGNIVITEGRSGNLYEIDPSGTVLWEYGVPNVYYLFRSERYASDYPAFVGKTLTANGNVELPASTYNCQLYSSTEEEKDNFILIIQNAANRLSVTMSTDFELKLFNINGQLLYQNKSANKQLEWVHELAPQIVLAQFVINDKAFTKKLFLNY